MVTGRRPRRRGRAHILLTLRVGYGILPETFYRLRKGDLHMKHLIVVAIALTSGLGTAFAADCAKLEGEWTGTCRLGSRTEIKSDVKIVQSGCVSVTFVHGLILAGFTTEVGESISEVHVRPAREGIPAHRVETITDSNWSKEGGTLSVYRLVNQKVLDRVSEPSHSKDIYKLNVSGDKLSVTKEALDDEFYSMKCSLERK